MQRNSTSASDLTQPLLGTQPTTPSTPVKPKSALKSHSSTGNFGGQTPKSPEGSRGIRFGSQRHRPDKPTFTDEELLDASKAGWDSEEEDDTSQLDNSQHSAQSATSTGSIVEPLIDKNKKYELRNPEAHAAVTQEMITCANIKTHKFAIALFPHHHNNYAFSKHIIQQHGYNRAIRSLTPQLRALENIEEIRAIRLNMLSTAHDQVTRWLEKVSLSDIINTLKNTAQQYYPSDPFAAVFFERYLFAVIDSEKGLLGYSSAKETLDCIFTLHNSFSALNKQFSIQLSCIRQHYQPYTLAAILFEQYLLENIQYFFATRITKNDFDKKFVETGIKFHNRFTEKLKVIVNTLPPAVSLWHIYYLLWHHSQVLLAQSNTNERVIETYTPFYAESNKNDGHNGVTLARTLDKELASRLSKIFFKQDSKTKQFTFKERDELASDKIQLERQGYVEYALYFTSVTMLMLDLLTASKVIKPALNPPGLTYFYFTGIGIATLLLGLLIRKSRLTSLREISETLDIFSQKKGPQLFLAHTDDFDSREAQTHTANPLSNRNADSSV